MLKNKKRFSSETAETRQDLLRIGDNNPLISEDLKSVILSLEARSEHPIATCLKNTWDTSSIKLVDGWEEVPGLGVRGKIDGVLWEFISDPDCNQTTRLSATLKREGQRLVTLEFSDSPRTGSHQLAFKESKTSAIKKT